jgi:hypothetical protein
VKLGTSAFAYTGRSLAPTTVRFASRTSGGILKSCAEIPRFDALKSQIEAHDSGSRTV